MNLFVPDKKRKISKGTTSINLLFILFLSSFISYQPIIAAAEDWCAKGFARLSGVVENAPKEFEEALADNITKVSEFAYILNEAEKLGVRAYMFGGTAAAYGHYVKWNLQRLKGDVRFQPDRFGFDYTDIFRSTQDADLVIDGPPELLEKAAVKLEEILKEKFGHLQGSKSVWEVRFLKQNRGDKGAILNDYDFLNQHSDSNSTGLIEITRPDMYESVIRDSRDWEVKESFFEQDLLEGKLHFYYAKDHSKTKRAKEGINPEIFSVIRYLTKAFQYELAVAGEDLIKVKQIIDEFKPNSVGSGYVNSWIEKNAKKLIQNAVNIEYAWNTLEELGLRKKLMAIKSDTGTQDSLAWWLNREPLRSMPLQGKPGKTAKELKLDIVAHETNNFLAYESITRAHTGDPNVLISRNNAVGEAAAYGDGFYTKVGTTGARNTGFTIRFHLNPDAVEGIDFTRNGDFIVVKNKNALKVNTESLKVNTLYYFELLAGRQQIQHSEKALLEKLKRRVAAQNGTIPEEDEKKIVSLVKEELQKSHGQVTDLLKEWFSLSIAKNYPEILEAVVKNKSFTELNLIELNVHPASVASLKKASTQIKDQIAFYNWQKGRPLYEELKDFSPLEKDEFLIRLSEAKNRSTEASRFKQLVEEGFSDLLVASREVSKTQMKLIESYPYPHLKEKAEKFLNTHSITNDRALSLLKDIKRVYGEA